MRLTFTNAAVVLPDAILRGSVRVDGGVIVSADSGPCRLPGALDMDGDFLLPGAVDVHTDNLERQVQPRSGARWPSRSALLAHDAQCAASGVTTVLDALCVGDLGFDEDRPRTCAEGIADITAMAPTGLLKADHYLHLRCELPAPNTVELFEPFRGHPRLSLISLMDHTPGQRQWENIELARIYYTGKKGWSDSKFEQRVAQAGMLQAEYAQPHRRHFVDYCRTHDIALASHDDTTVAHVEQAHAEGASMSEFPTTLDAARAARRLGLANIMGGPNVMRGGSHSGNVAASELARHGLLDILSSDYVPGSLLGAVVRLVDEEIATLAQAVAMVTRTPARAARLPDRGALQTGLRADLVQVRMCTLADGARHPVVRGVWREGRRVL